MFRSFTGDFSPEIKEGQLPDSEIVCALYGHRQALAGDTTIPVVFKGYRHFELYRCPCGAVGSMSGDPGEAGWSLDRVEGFCRPILWPRGAPAPWT